MVLEKNQLVIYLLSVMLLLIAAYIIFRILVRRDYRQRGRLTLLSSFLELVIWLSYAAVPYIYNPPCWPYAWDCKPHSPPFISVLGYFLISVGVILGFGSMFWLGIQRSFGQQVTGLYRSGPYLSTRNPQVLGGSMMVAGIALLWPSWYALGWAILWMAMFHPMIVTEEEHLRQVYGEEYVSYCIQVPRYFGRGSNGI